MTKLIEKNDVIMTDHKLEILTTNMPVLKKVNSRKIQPHGKQLSEDMDVGSENLTYAYQIIIDRYQSYQI